MIIFLNGKIPFIASFFFLQLTSALRRKKGWGQTFKQWNEYAKITLNQLEKENATYTVCSKLIVKSNLLQMDTYVHFIVINQIENYSRDLKIFCGFGILKIG